MKTVGSLIDALGVPDPLPKGYLADGAFVVLRAVDERGRTTAFTCYSEGLDFITRSGLLLVAQNSENMGHAIAGDA